MWFKFYRVKKITKRTVSRGMLAGTDVHYQAHRAAAQEFVAKRLPELNQVYHLAYHRITIKNQASRWGSCSKLGNLNFHYKIAFLPPELADYILVHELCHLQELNHSSAFWKLVAMTVPNYTVRKQQLKRYTFK